MKKILFIFLFLFWASDCFGATQLLKTVEEDGNGDYTSLEACMNANEQNLVTADQYFDVKICGTDLGGGGWDAVDTTAVTIHNYTTDATRYINIYTTATGRHNGTAASVSGLKNYRLGNIVLPNAGAGLNNSIDYVTVDGIEIVNIDPEYSGSGPALLSSGGSHSVIKNNIIHEVSGDNGQGIQLWDYGNTAFNNIVYDIDESGIRCRCYGGGMQIYNNTVYNYNRDNDGSEGIDFYQYVSYDGTDYSKNNLVIAVTGGSCYNYTDGTRTATHVTDGGSDTTGDIDNLTAADLFVSTTTGSEDLHLKAGADAIDVGTDLGSPYDYDIDGDFRDTYTPWDIGADEYVSAAPSVLPTVIINIF